MVFLFFLLSSRLTSCYPTIFRSSMSNYSAIRKSSGYPFSKTLSAILKKKNTEKTISQMCIPKFYGRFVVKIQQWRQDFLTFDISTIIHIDKYIKSLSIFFFFATRKWKLIFATNKLNYSNESYWLNEVIAVYKVWCDKFASCMKVKFKKYLYFLMNVNTKEPTILAVSKILNWFIRVFI